MGDRCAACEATSWRLLHRVGDHIYLQCTACGTGRLDPLPTVGQATEAYGIGYFEGGQLGGYVDYDGEVSAREGNALAVLGRLQARVQPPGRLLELGCASGWLLEAAERRGWAVVGVEPNDEMRTRAASRTESGELFRSIDDLGPSSFDAAVLVQVLEHLPDAGLVLDRLAALLAPDGVLLIETWDRASLVARLLRSRWQQVTPPSVLWLFSSKSIAAAVRRRGFTDVVVRRTSKRVGVASVVGLVAEKSPVGKARLTSLAHHDRVRAMTVPYRLGDLITVTARAATGDRGSLPPTDSAM